MSFEIVGPAHIETFAATDAGTQQPGTGERLYDGLVRPFEEAPLAMGSVVVAAAVLAAGARRAIHSDRRWGESIRSFLHDKPQTLSDTHSTPEDLA